MSRPVKIIIALAVVGVLGYLAIWAIAANTFLLMDFGEVCTSEKQCESDCATTATGGYCTYGCSEDSDCPDGWKCEPILIKVIEQNGEMTDQGRQAICIQPAATPEQSRRARFVP